MARRRSMMRDKPTEVDRKRLAAGGARGGDYGPLAVAVFGGDDGDDTTVVEYVRGVWRVTVLDGYGRRRAEEVYQRRADAFNEASVYGNNIVEEAESERMRRTGAVANPSRRAIDHKFAGALFSANQPKIALAYLRGTLTKSAARARAAGTKRR